MPEPTGYVRCCVRAETHCSRCDLLVGLPGLHVVDVADDGGRGRLTVTVELAATVEGCPVCGVIASSRGRQTVRLVDAP